MTFRFNNNNNNNNLAGNMCPLTQFEDGLQSVKQMKDNTHTDWKTNANAQPFSRL